MKIWSSHLLDNLSNCLMNLKNSIQRVGRPCSANCEGLVASLHGANWTTCYKFFNMFYHSLRIFGRRERIRLRANIMLLLTHMHYTLNVILVFASKAPTRMFACCRLHGVSRIWIILTKKMASVEVVETSSTKHIETTTMPRVTSQGAMPA